MNEREKKTVESLQDIVNDKELEKVTLYKLGIQDIEIASNLIEKQAKEIQNLKEIEKTHKEENGKLRVELEQKEQIIKRLEQDVEGYRDLSKQIQADYSKQIREYEEGYNE